MWGWYIFYITFASTSFDDFYNVYFSTTFSPDGINIAKSQAPYVPEPNDFIILKSLILNGFL